MKNIFIFFYIFIFILEPLGLYHSYDKHDGKDLTLSLFLPPLAWYRGIEMFYHKNEIDKTKLRILKSDIMDLLRIYNSVAQNPPDIDNKLNTIKSNIKSYNEEEIEYFKFASKAYCLYQANLNKDLNKSIKYSNLNDNFNLILSKETIKSFKKLEYYKLGFNLEKDKKTIESTFKNLIIQINDIKINDINRLQTKNNNSVNDTLINYMIEYNKEILKKFGIIHYSIFKEKIPQLS